MPTAYLILDLEAATSFDSSNVTFCLFVVVIMLSPFSHLSDAWLFFVHQLNKEDKALMDKLVVVNNPYCQDYISCSEGCWVVKLWGYILGGASQLVSG